MSKVQRHSHDQQTIQNILDKILNKKLSNTFPGIFGSGKTVRCPRPKDTLAITVGYFFPLLFHGNVRLRHLWPRASKATPANHTVLLSCLFETNSK